MAALHSLAGLMGADAAALYYLDAPRRHLHDAAAPGVGRVHASVGTSIAGAAALSGEVVLVRRTGDDRRYNDAVDGPASTVACAPVALKAHCAGVLQLRWAKPEDDWPTAEDELLFLAAAAACAAALQHTASEAHTLHAAAAHQRGAAQPLPGDIAAQRMAAAVALSCGASLETFAAHAAAAAESLVPNCQAALYLQRCGSAGLGRLSPARDLLPAELQSAGNLAAESLGAGGRAPAPAFAGNASRSISESGLLPPRLDSAPAAASSRNASWGIAMRPLHAGAWPITCSGVESGGAALGGSGAALVVLRWAEAGDAGFSGGGFTPAEASAVATLAAGLEVGLGLLLLAAVPSTPSRAGSMLAGDEDGSPLG